MSEMREQVALHIYSVLATFAPENSIRVLLEASRREADCIIAAIIAPIEAERDLLAKKEAEHALSSGPALSTGQTATAQ